MFNNVNTHLNIGSPNQNRELNRALNTLNQVSSILGPDGQRSGGIAVDTGFGGTTIYNDARNSGKKPFKVVLVDNGPGGGGDYKDYHYFAREIIYVMDKDGNITMQENPEGFWDQVINPGEIIGNTHNLPVCPIDDNGHVIPTDPYIILNCTLEELHTNSIQPQQTASTDLLGTGFIGVLDSTTSDYFYGIISSPVLISGENARWTYTAKEIITLPGGRNQILTGGRVITGVTNWNEDGNPTIGYSAGPVPGGLPNGFVTSTEFSNGIKIQPVTGNATYKIFAIRDCTNGLQHKFFGPNFKSYCGPAGS